MMYVGGTDLSSYANWLYNHYPIFRPILNKIDDCYNGEKYAIILDMLCSECDKKMLRDLNNISSDGSIYEETGIFHWEEDEDGDE